MKNAQLRTLLCLMTFFCQLLMTPTYATEVPDPVDGVLTITVQNAGDLSSNYAAADITAKGATKLKIVGPLNDYYDFTRIKDVIDATLTQVDLSEAVLPDNTLPSSAFWGESTLTTVVLPSNLVAFGSSAFGNCSALTSINLPSSLNNIESSAFSGCSALTSLVFNVTGGLYVGPNAFRSCTQLNSITINAGGDVTLSVYNEGIFDNCTALQRFELHTPGKLTSPRAQLFYINTTGAALTTVILDAQGEGSTIATQAFQYCKQLTSVTLPASLTDIGFYFFYECNALTSVTIPAGLTTMGSGAFQGCSSLTSLDFSQTQLSTIDQTAFSGCTSLESISLPASLTSIGSSVFSQCSSLQSIDLSGTQIISLPNSAFSQCSSLASVQLPATINNIGDNAFYYCTSLPSLTLNVTGALNIGYEAFNNCPQLTSISITAGGDVTQPNSYRPIQSCPALQTFELHTPGKFTSNCDQLFYMNNTGGSLTTVILDAQGAGSYMGQQAFHYCKQLTSVTLPAGLTAIPNSFFYECNSLASVTIPASVTSIGDNAFYNCYALESLDLSATQVATIGSSAFSNCDALASVSLPAGITSLGNSAFYYCKELGSIDLSQAQITSLSYNTFSNCTKLTSVQLPATINSIGGSAFHSSGLTTFSFTTNQSLTIGNNAFYNCKSLTDVSLTAGGGMFLDHSAFSNCTVLRNMTINAVGDVTLGTSQGGVFSSCTALENFELHTQGKLTDGYRNMFWNYPSSALQRAILDARGAGSVLGESAFGYCSQLQELVLPAGLVSLGRSAFHDCSSLPNVTIPATLTTVDGYDMFEGCSSLQSIDFSQTSLTALGDNAFSGCSSLTSVSLPNGFTTISQSMFNGCSSLTTINLPASITSIGQYAFNGCAQLPSINVPANVTTMGDYAFRNCSALTTATVACSIATLPQYTFAGCSSLQTISFTGSITTIGDRAFDGCSQLRDITLPSGLTTINQYAFNDCSSLATIALPATLTTLGNGVFDGCTGLISLEIPEGVSELPQSVFSGCTGMQSLYLPSTITTINYSAFYNLNSLIDLHIQATTPPPFSYYSRAPQVSLFVPEASISAYQAADNWKNFGHIYAELTNLATLDDGEYALLQQIYTSTSGDSWKRPWTFGATKAETAMLAGVKVNDGHVVQIALVDNNLQGELPQQLLQFPNAWYVNVSRNNFSGDIGAYFDAMSTPNTVLTYLDLSNNRFSGNIGRMNYLNDKLPALTTLKIAYNRISDVKPVLPAHITTLDLRGQEVHFNDHHYLFSSFISIDPANMPDLFPSILTYRHSTYRDHGNRLFLLAAPDAEEPWAVEMHKNSTNTSTNRFIYISTGGWNFLPSGSIVYLSDLERNVADRIRIRMEFDYPMGDIDYNGAIDVSDLQTLINFAIYPEGYSRSSLFNWAAANLIAADQGDEEVINVQDVVAEVNVLLDNYVVPVIPARQQTTAPGGFAADTSIQATAAGGSAADTAPQATLSLDGQQLVLTTSVPVAAMHLQLADDDCRWQPALGLMSHRQKSGRHVFYSMSGDQLSAGTHVLAQVGTAQLEYAMLVDIDGKPIRCTIDHNAPTGIETIGQIDNLQIDNCYDLSGRKIVKSSNRQMGKGVYIVDGKKHIVK